MNLWKFNSNSKESNTPSAQIGARKSVRKTKLLIQALSQYSVTDLASAILSDSTRKKQKKNTNVFRNFKMRQHQPNLLSIFFWRSHRNIKRKDW